MKKIELDFTNQVIPYFIYKRITIAGYREYFTFQLDAGYGYLLREIELFHREDYNWRDNNNNERAVLSLEFFDNAVNHARQLQPVPSNLINSYEFDVINYTGAPVQTLPQIENVLNVPKKNKILNYFYPENDTIRIDITGQIHNTKYGWSPKQIDVMLKGYYIPSKHLKQWAE